MGFANLFVLPDEKGYLDFLSPHSYVGMCFLVAKPPPNPKWLDLVLPLELETWLGTIATLAICTLFLASYGILSPNAECSPGYAVFILISIVSCVNDPLYQKFRYEQDQDLREASSEYPGFTRSGGLRLFFTLFTLLMFVLTIEYRGGLNASFTVSIIPQPMDSIAELAKSVS